MAEVSSIKVIDFNSIERKKNTLIKKKINYTDQKMCKNEENLQYLHVVNLLYRQFIFY